MRILLVGNRAIQHALASRLMREGNEVDVYPGQRAGVYRTVGRDEVGSRHYDLLVLGSPRYFHDPLVEQALTRGALLFGPDANAAMLETSKNAFRHFASDKGIRIPAGQTFFNVTNASEYIQRGEPPFVVKADGPAGGCGVSICHSIEEALADIVAKFDTSDGNATEAVVIEDFVKGFEVAVNVLIDEHTAVVLPPTKPHKRRYRSDRGPNVAGMGSIAPICLNNRFYEQLHVLLGITRQGLNEHGWFFRGCLFINLMLTESELVVLEYNTRMGDPAMLVDIPLTTSSLGDALYAVARGELAQTEITIDMDLTACAVTLVDRAYPSVDFSMTTVDINEELFLGEHESEGIAIAGAALGSSGVLEVNNGVVASAIATSRHPQAAISRAYAIARQVPQVDYRDDIAQVLQPPPRYANHERTGVQMISSEKNFDAQQAR